MAGIHHWEEILNMVDGEAKWAYASALRGPDLPRELASIAKQVLTCLIRGKDDSMINSIKDFFKFFRGFSPTTRDREFEEVWMQIMDSEGGRHWSRHIATALGVLQGYYLNRFGCVGERISELINILGRKILYHQGAGILDTLKELSHELEKLEEP